MQRLQGDLQRTYFELFIRDRVYMEHMTVDVSEFLDMHKPKSQLAT